MSIFIEGIEFTTVDEDRAVSVSSSSTCFRSFRNSRWCGNYQLWQSVSTWFCLQRRSRGPCHNFLQPVTLSPLSPQILVGCPIVDDSWLWWRCVRPQWLANHAIVISIISSVPDDKTSCLFQGYLEALVVPLLLMHIICQPVRAAPSLPYSSWVIHGKRGEPSSVVVWFLKRRCVSWYQSVGQIKILLLIMTSKILAWCHRHRNKSQRHQVFKPVTFGHFLEITCTVTWSVFNWSADGFFFCLVTTLGIKIKGYTTIV